MYYKVTARYKTDEDNTTFEFIAETEDADGGKDTEKRRKKRRRNGENEGVLERVKQSAAGEQLLIPTGREAAEHRHTLTVVKGKNDHHDKRRIEQCITKFFSCFI